MDDGDVKDDERYEVEDERVSLGERK